VLSAGALAGSTARAADLSVVITPTSFAGGRLDYLIALDNDGPGPARNAVVSARLPAGRLFGVQAVEVEVPGECRRSGRAVTCVLGTLPAHDYQEVVISMRAPARGTYVLSARISSPTPDPEPGNNTDRASILVP
jgi:large repetitive protein